MPGAAHGLGLALATLLGAAAAAEPPACPEGARLVGAAPPADSEAWCARPDALGTPVRHGPWMRWRPDGTPLALAEYRDGKLHGRSVGWHQNGQREREGSYRFGRAEGVFQRWTRDGHKVSEVRFSAGALEGWAVAWHPHGVKAHEVRYRANRLHGPSREWFPDGGPRSEGHYADGERDGTWKFWYRRGALDLVGSYAGGIRHGPWERRWPNGRIWWQGSYRQGRRHGSWKFFDENGRQAASGSYRDGAREGSWQQGAPGEESRTVAYKGGRRVDGSRADPDVLAEITPGLAPRLSPAQAVALARERLPVLGLTPRSPPEPRLEALSADIPSDADEEGSRSWSVPRSFVGIVWHVEFAGRFVRTAGSGPGAALLPDAERARVEVPDSARPGMER